MRSDVESVFRPRDPRDCLSAMNSVIDAYLVRVALKILGDLSPARSGERRQLFPIDANIVLSKGVPRQRQHSSIAQRANIPACLYGIIDPLPTWRGSIANYKMRYRFLWPKCPAEISCPLQITCVSMRLYERVQEDIDRECLSRVPKL